MKQPVQYDRDRIFQEAEALARIAHQQSTHLDKDWKVLNGKQIGMRLDDRVRRAREYAAWRIGAYENGEVRTPW